MKTIITLVLFAVTAQAQPRKLDPNSIRFGPYAYHFSGFSESANMKTIVGKDTTTKLAPYSAVAIFTLLQSWDAYLVWCADTVQKRGWDRLVMDKTRPHIDNEGGRTFYYAKSVPTYYREPRQPHPTFNGFIEWLREEFVAREGQTKKTKKGQKP